MSLKTNLPKLRKIHNLSQEGLAEQLGVSRQSVSKWESGEGYPETEKIISICELFDCKMDDLVRGEVTPSSRTVEKQYDKVMTKAIRLFAIGLLIIFLGIAMMLTLMALDLGGMLETQRNLIGEGIFLASVIVAIPIFTVGVVEVRKFRRRNLVVHGVYSEQEIEDGQAKYTRVFVAGVEILLAAVMVWLILIATGLIEDNGYLTVAIMMYFVMVGEPVIYYAARMAGKYNLERYNYQNTREYREKIAKIRKIYGVIFLIATAIFLIWGLAGGEWSVNWLVYPVAAVICAIIGTTIRKWR